MNIGIVEDQESIREMLTTGLRVGGHHVTAYANAQECLQALFLARLNNTPLPHEIIVTDLDLREGIDGAEMIRRIRQFITAEELPVLLMTGQERSERILLRQNLLDIKVLKKPLSIRGLTAEMRAEIAKKQL